jgi:hypothetical protein
VHWEVRSLYRQKREEREDMGVKKRRREWC